MIKMGVYNQFNDDYYDDQFGNQINCKGVDKMIMLMR